MFVIEGNNILGKIEGLLTTRFMTDAAPVFKMSAETLISRYFPQKKE
jgi:hypothetical protein